MQGMQAKRVQITYFWKRRDEEQCMGDEDVKRRERQKERREVCNVTIVHLNKIPARV
jgi:hypothetical protein